MKKLWQSWTGKLTWLKDWISRKVKNESIFDRKLCVCLKFNFDDFLQDIDHKIYEILKTFKGYILLSERNRE